MNAYCGNGHRNNCGTKSRYPCKYQELGCKVTNWAIDFGGHERSCKYKPYTVPKVFGDCHWTGSVHQLIQHLTYHHKVVVTDGNHFVQRWKMEEMTDHNNNIWPNVVHYNNHYFMLCCEKRGKSPDFVFKFFVVFIGQQSDAMKYKYKYEIVNQLNGNGLTFEGRPNSIREETALTDSDGLVFDLSTAKRFINNNKLRIDLKIFNI